MAHVKVSRWQRTGPAPARKTWPFWAVLVAVLVLTVGLCGPWRAAGAPARPAPQATDDLNRRALDALEAIRRAYPIEFGEAHAIHEAIRLHLQAGGDSADARHIVKRAVIEGCRAACMEAVFDAFTRLNQAGVPAAEVQTLLTQAIHDSRRGMPPRYTYEMLGAAITERVDQRLSAAPPAR